MDNSKLIASIHASLAQAKSPEQIYLELLKQGHLVKNIQDAFAAAEAAQEEPATEKRTIGLVLLIGAVLVGAGIFSFIAANWQEMSKSLKIAVIIISMLMSHGTGWVLKERFHWDRTGNALILLGSIIYGGGIFLIGQIFHIRANWPDGFILWMMGVIPMGFAIRSYPLVFLSIGVGVVGVAGHPFGIFDAFEGYNPFLLTSSFLLLGATAVTLLAGIFVRKVLPAKTEEDKQ